VQTVLTLRVSQLPVTSLVAPGPHPRNNSALVGALVDAGQRGAAVGLEQLCGDVGGSLRSRGRRSSPPTCGRGGWRTLADHLAFDATGLEDPEVIEGVRAQGFVW
jgi:hypothetical protein